jgi:plasmid stabilization system protein ParE
MAEFRLTERARADLIDIYGFTESKFGAYQADAYYSGLVRSFGLLADFPASASRLTSWRQAIDVLAFNHT